MRPCLEFVKVRFKGEIVGAEVGVKLGENAVDMLTNMPNLSLLYLIDPYLPYVDWNTPYKYRIQVIQAQAKQNLQVFSDRVKWVPHKSEDSESEINHDLDFMYIDGNHDYEFVQKDIELAMHKVKSGGVIGGDDYNKTHDFPGVIKAVDDACKTFGLILNVKDFDWWIVKP